jgi:hypothetical protein
MPTEEDMNNAEGHPSITVYRERFGSWNKACELFGNKLLIEKKCKNCKAVFHTKRKDWIFCSNACQREYMTGTQKRRVKKFMKDAITELGKKCAVCDFAAIVEVHDTRSKTDSEIKLARDFKKKNLEGYVLLCPNHHLMVHRKLGKLEKKENVWIIQ